MTSPAVLYIEDDPRSRTVMDILLRGAMGLNHVTIFEDSANFLERVKALTPIPSVIFLDIHLTPHNGFEMLTMLRQEQAFAKIPIIALTASVMNEEVQQLKKAGFDGCIAKPLDVDTFPDTFQRILKGEFIWRIS